MNVTPLLNPYHKKLFQSCDGELVVKGGANAGKTYSICDKLLSQPVFQCGCTLRTLVVRRTLPSIRNSVIPIMEKRAHTLGLPFHLNKGDWTAKVLSMRIDFLSLHNKEDYTKIKSITDVDFIFCNEVPELQEWDYEFLLTRLRGGNSAFSQMISDFNPIGKNSWVYNRFYKRNVGNPTKLKYTVYDNPWATQLEIQRLQATKDHNPNFYKIYFLGEWGELKGVIFDWDIVSKTKEQEAKNMSWEEIICPDEVFYGGDFGYSVDPAVLVRIYRKANEYWLEEVIYETGLNNIQLAKRIKKSGVDPKADEYWDAAEPKSIDELHREGLNAKPALKGPDSIRAGIDFLKAQTIHIIDGSQNIINEQKGYVWKVDKDGNFLNVPIDYNNHTMDAIRYGIYTNSKREKGYSAWSEQSWR